MSPEVTSISSYSLLESDGVNSDSSWSLRLSLEVNSISSYSLIESDTVNSDSS